MSGFVLVCIVVVVAFLTGNDAANTDDKPLKQNITQDELKKKLADSNDHFFVYIGRPSCPDCVVFEPVLNEFLEQKNSSIYYYNTDAKASQKQAIRDYLDSIEVPSVPFILHVKNGEITRRYDGQKETDITQFKADYEKELNDEF